MTIALAVHGGAGATRSLSYTAQRDHLRAVVMRGREMLSDGASALDAVCALTVELEDSGLYIAGRGSSPNTLGEYELDACVADGKTGRAGAVACLRGYRNPISVARLVMERTPHVLFAGSGAEAFAHAAGAERVPAGARFTHAGQGEANYAPGVSTAGCVALDRNGNLAAATSTGGVFDKTPGRIGDAPILGAGTWADARVAVSCSGQGELFMRTAAAAHVAFLAEHGAPIREAAAKALARITALGGYGGIIGVDAAGNVAMPNSAEGFKRAALMVNGDIVVQIFDEE